MALPPDLTILPRFALWGSLSYPGPFAAFYLVDTRWARNSAYQDAGGFPSQMESGLSRVLNRFEEHSSGADLQVLRGSSRTRFSHAKPRRWRVWRRPAAGVDARPTTRDWLAHDGHVV